MKISVVIPAFNEAGRIIPTIKAYHAYLQAQHPCFEILVVDDGSTDNTVQLIEELAEYLAGLMVLPLRENKGKGNAVRQGMLAVTGDLRLFTDADGSTAPAELQKLLQPILTGAADIAIGSRYIAGSQVATAQPKLRIKWSRSVNKLVQRVLLPGIADTHCGFKAFTATAAAELFAQCNIDGWSFDLEVLGLARKLGFTIAEVPVKWANDERSKGRLAHLPREVYNFCKIKKQMKLISGR